MNIARNAAKFNGIMQGIGIGFYDDPAFINDNQGTCFGGTVGLQLRPIDLLLRNYFLLLCFQQMHGLECAHRHKLEFNAHSLKLFLAAADSSF